MAKNKDIVVIIVPSWMDEIDELILNKNYIGDSVIYFTEKCCDCLKKRITEDKVKFISCSNPKCKLFRLEKLCALGLEIPSKCPLVKSSLETTIFIFKKPGEEVGGIE